MKDSPERKLLESLLDTPGIYVNDTYVRKWAKLIRQYKQAILKGTK